MACDVSPVAMFFVKARKQDQMTHFGIVLPIKTNKNPFVPKNYFMTLIDNPLTNPGWPFFHLNHFQCCCLCVPLKVATLIRQAYLSQEIFHPIPETSTFINQNWNPNNWICHHVAFAHASHPYQSISWLVGTWWYQLGKGFFASMPLFLPSWLALREIYGFHWQNSNFKAEFSRLYQRIAFNLFFRRDAFHLPFTIYYLLVIIYYVKLPFII